MESEETSSTDTAIRGSSFIGLGKPFITNPLRRPTPLSVVVSSQPSSIELSEEAERNHDAWLHNIAAKGMGSSESAQPRAN